MPYADIPAFYASLGDDRDAVAMKLLILTAARTGMVRLATWDEFDREEKVWELSAERMKVGVPFRIPLTPAVEALLDLLPRIGRSNYLFPGTGKSGVINRVALLRLLPTKGLTVHGFRSGFRDWASDHTDHLFEVGEKALAHKVGDYTARAYARSDFLEKRRELMQEWAEFVTSKCV